MAARFTVEATDPERAAYWRRTLGTAEVPVIAPAVELARLPPGHGQPGTSWVYKLDLEALTEAQIENLVTATAERFGEDSWRVRRDLKREGMPIPESGVVLRVDGVEAEPERLEPPGGIDMRLLVP